MAKNEKAKVGKAKKTAVGPAFPRHTIDQALRIPRAILDQGAGKPCTGKEAAGFLGIKPSGSFNVEIASAGRYGFLDRPGDGKIQPSELAKRILRPQDPKDELAGYRDAILRAPLVSDVYNHYRGENLPDDKFLANALTDKFNLPAANVAEFKDVFISGLERAQLLTKHGDKVRVLDVTSEPAAPGGQPASPTLEKLSRAVKVESGQSCFVMMPFADPHGLYYEKVYAPAIEKAGLRPVRADASIFGTGKIMDQVWSGINAATVLVAELTTKNPNVFYELGLAHALKKPVVLVSSNEDDVPFDLKHIRVIYYDVNDPFWGNKLIEKVAENILSAIQNPEEAVFRASE
jgi:hypothetical protein